MHDRNTKTGQWPRLTGAVLLTLLVVGYIGMRSPGTQGDGTDTGVAAGTHGETLPAPPGTEWQAHTTATIIPTDTPYSVEMNDQHLPVEPARMEFITDPSVYRRRLEALLNDDEESLAQVQSLLDEPDPVLLTQNLQLLQDTFGTE